MSKLGEQINDILSPGKDDDFPGSNLLTIPGVGPKTVAAVLSAVGSGARSFATCKHFIGYIGFFPQIYESGETRRDNRLSNRGPKYLRWALYVAAVACLRHNAELKNLYQKKRSQGKAPKQALICVAKKLGHLMFSMLKSGEAYRPQRVFIYS